MDDDQALAGSAGSAAAEGFFVARSRRVVNDFSRVGVSTVITRTTDKAHPVSEEGPALPALRVEWLLVGAGALALLTASRVYLSLSVKGMAEPPLPILAGEALRWALWLPVVPLILAIERRWGFSRQPWPAAAAAHLGVAASVLLAHTLVMTSVGTAAGWYFAMETPRDTLMVQLVHEGMGSLLVYAAVVGAAHARRHMHEREMRRLAQASLAARLARERLRNLQMQLHPHFLFNALHAVGGIIRDGDRKLAVDTVSDLGELLRRSLEQGDRQLVTLEEELDFTRAYLKIQHARFGSRLSVRFDVSSEARRALVPHLILQPLVENAIRHGTSQRDAGGTVNVRAFVSGGRVQLEVSDDGPGMPKHDSSEGTGLRNTRERLEELYGRAAGLLLERSNGGTTVVRVEIPLRTAEGGVPV